MVCISNIMKKNVKVKVVFDTFIISPYPTQLCLMSEHSETNECSDEMAQNGSIEKRKNLVRVSVLTGAPPHLPNCLLYNTIAYISKGWTTQSRN